MFSIRKGGGAPAAPGAPGAGPTAEQLAAAKAAAEAAEAAQFKHAATIVGVTWAALFAVSFIAKQLK